MSTSGKERYPFARSFEVSIAGTLHRTPRYYETIGYALDPERIPSADLRLIVSTTQKLAKSAGTGAINRTLIEQQLRIQHDSGKVTLDQIAEVKRLLDVADDTDDSDPEAVIAVTVSAVRRFAEAEALEATIKDAATGLDAKTVERFDQVVALGKSRGVTHVPSVSGEEDDLSASVAPVAPGERLPTGVGELDILLRGGMERKALGMVQADTGGGKSLFLSHILANTVMLNIPSLYITLELSELEVKKRVYCNLCDMTVEEIRAKPHEAARRYKMLKERGLALWGVVYQTPRATTMQHIRRIVKDTEKEWGIEIPALFVDEAGKVVWKLNAEMRSYDEQRNVYQELRNIAVEKNGWAWTASQVKSGFEGKKRLGVDAGADSKEKARLSDVIVELPRTHEDMAQGTIRMRVPKRRVDEAFGEAGPLPMDAAHGRIALVNDRVNPWDAP